MDSFDEKCTTSRKATENLFNNEFLSDIKLVVDNVSIPAHRFELFKRSSVFREQINGMHDQISIEIPGVKLTVFFEFLSFIYTDVCEINKQNALELLKLAYRYKVYELEKQIWDFISLNYESFGIQLFDFCVNENYTFLFHISKCWTMWYLTSIIETKEFLSISKPTLQLILVQGFAECTEKQLFAAVFKWIENHCTVGNMSGVEKETLTENLIKNIRFPTMSESDFRSCIKEQPNLFDISEIDLILKSISSKKNETRFEIKPRTITYGKHNSLKSSELETFFLVKKSSLLKGLWVEFANIVSSFSIKLLNQEGKILKDLSYKGKAFESHLVSFNKPCRLKLFSKYKIEIECQPGSGTYYDWYTPNEFVDLTEEFGWLKRLIFEE